MIERYVLGLEEIDKSQVALVGGKGASLGELARIEGIRVPAGFCVTTDAFRRVMTMVPWVDDQLDRLSRLDQDDRQAMRDEWIFPFTNPALLRPRWWLIRQIPAL